MLLQHYNDSSSFSFMESLPVIIVLLLIVIFAIRVLRGYSLAKRALSQKSILVEGKNIDSLAFRNAIVAKLKGRKIPKVSTRTETVSNSFITTEGSNYLVIERKPYLAYITAFDMGEDSVISYWEIAYADDGISLLEAIPFIGKALAEMKKTPTLYMADIQAVTKTMITVCIDEVIDEFTGEEAKTRTTTQEFQSYIEALTK